MSKTKHLIVLGVVLAMITGMAAAQTYPGGVEIDDDTDHDEYDFPEADSIEAEAGMIHEAELSTEMPTDYWSGLFGTAEGQLILGYEDDGNQVLYEWDADGAVVYAAHDDETIEDWEDLTESGTVDHINADEIADAESDAYGNTFDQDETFESDALNIDEEGISAADTEGEGVTYHLTDDNGDVNAYSVFATDVFHDGDGDLFNGDSMDNAYEMILPVDRQDASQYDLYIELE